MDTVHNTHGRNTLSNDFKGNLGRNIKGLEDGELIRSDHNGSGWLVNEKLEGLSLRVNNLIHGTRKINPGKSGYTKPKSLH